MEEHEHTGVTEEIRSLKERLAQKELEIRELRTKNLFLGTIFDGINEEIVILDSDFNIKDVNQAFLNRYALTKPSVLNKKCYEIKQRSNAPCNTDQHSCPLALAKSSGKRVELTHHHKDENGRMQEMIMLMYPISSLGEEVDYFMEIARDVTEYRSLFRKLQASEKRLRAILDTATDAILSIDENQKIMLFNDAAQRIFGYSREEVLDKDLSLIIPPRYGDHHKYVRHFLDKRKSDIMGKTISLTGLRNSGEEFPLEISLSFLEMGGEITFTAIIRDVSEHRRLEKKLLQSERLAAVGKAAARVAHELKNPLMIIGGLSNQIRKSLMDAKDLQKIEMILEEVKRLERLVANLGDFTREYKLLKRPANVNWVIKDVLKTMRLAYSEEKYEFKEFLSHEVTEINCDPDKLKQLFINIISNGLEAMADGGSIVVVSKMIPQGIEIKFNDDGTGIPETDIQQIFEPFFTTRDKGSGLGLSISYKIVQAHNGDITAVSSEGEGTTFTIRLPAT